MIVPRIIRDYRINFYIGSTALADDRRSGSGRLQFNFIWERIGNMEDALARLPNSHLELLTEVPIIIWNGPEGARGGWYPPDNRSARWLNPVRTQRNFGVNGAEVANLPHSNGIISITTNVLASRARGDVQRCMLTIIHEAGHCVDHHLNLTSRPSRTRYRNGNLAYQGQRYGSGYNEHEFKAETYSRLFMTPSRICRRARSLPPCLNSSGHSTCNARLQRDLGNTAAFQALGTDMNRYLPLAAADNESEEAPSSSRGLIGQAQETRLATAQLSPHAQGRVPGPVGLA